MKWYDVNVGCELIEQEGKSTLLKAATKGYWDDVKLLLDGAEAAVVNEKDEVMWIIDLVSYKFLA